MKRFLFLLTFILLAQSSLALENYTREDAVLAINQAEITISTMIKDSLSIQLVNDSLIQAKLVLRQVDYAEILRNSSSTLYERQEALIILDLTNWKELSYNEIIEITSKIQENSIQAYYLKDSISLIKIQIQNLQNNKIDTTSLIENLRIIEEDFSKERYSEANEKIDKINEEIDSKISEYSNIKAAGLGIVNLIKRNIVFVSILLISIFAISYFVYRIFRKKILEKRIKHLKATQLSLIELIKKAQTERYKNKSISELVYKIRMEHYNSKKDEINEILPVLESNLRHINKVETKKPKRKSSKSKRR
jgi:hypothetical protein